MIKPFFQELSEKYPSVQFLKVDVDDQSQITEEADVSAMPTFHVYVNGKKTDELVGASKTSLEAMIKKVA